MYVCIMHFLFLKVWCPNRSPAKWSCSIWYRQTENLKLIRKDWYFLLIKHDWAKFLWYKQMSTLNFHLYKNTWGHCLWLRMWKLGHIIGLAIHLVFLLLRQWLSFQCTFGFIISCINKADQGCMDKWENELWSYNLLCMMLQEKTGGILSVIWNKFFICFFQIMFHSNIKWLQIEQCSSFLNSQEY